MRSERPAPGAGARLSAGVDARLVVPNGGGSMQLDTFSAADVLGTRTIDTIEFLDAETTMTGAQFVSSAGVDIKAGPGSAP